MTRDAVRSDGTSRRCEYSWRWVTRRLIFARAAREVVLLLFAFPGLLLKVATHPMHVRTESQDPEQPETIRDRVEDDNLPRNDQKDEHERHEREAEPRGDE